MFHPKKPAPGGASYPLMRDSFGGPWSSIERVSSAVRLTEDDDFEGIRNWSVILIFGAMLVPALALVAALVL